jgi:hypothetical protein
MVHDTTDKEKEDKKNLTNNLRTVLISALSVSVALGFNDLIMTIFNSFPNSQHIIAKTTYLVTMIGITLLASYFLFELSYSVKTTSKK